MWGASLGFPRPCVRYARHGNPGLVSRLSWHRNGAVLARTRVLLAWDASLGLPLHLQAWSVPWNSWRVRDAPPGHPGLASMVFSVRKSAVLARTRVLLAWDARLILPFHLQAWSKPWNSPGVVLCAIQVPDCRGRARLEPRSGLFVPVDLPVPVLSAPSGSFGRKCGRARAEPRSGLFDPVDLPVPVLRAPSGSFGRKRVRARAEPGSAPWALFFSVAPPHTSPPSKTRNPRTVPRGSVM